MLFYSPSAAGFFDDAIHSVLPADAVAIDAQTHAQLLHRQSLGDVIVPGADGTPEAVARPAPSNDDLYAALRDARTQLLTASDWTQMADAPLTEAQREQWRIYRQALRDLPETTTDPAAPEWPLPPA